MLQLWHNAPKRAPEKEARLLYVNNTNGAGGLVSNDDDEKKDDDPNAQQNNEDAENTDANGGAIIVGGFQQEAREQLGDTLTNSQVRAAQQVESAEENTKQLREKIAGVGAEKKGGLGEKIAKKIKDGTFAFHSIPLANKDRGMPDMVFMAELLIEEYPEHEAVYRPLLLKEDGTIIEEHITGLQGAYDVMKAAHEELLATLKEECKEFVKDHSEDYTRSSQAVDAFAATKVDAAGNPLPIIQDTILEADQNRTDMEESARSVIANPESLRAAELVEKLKELRGKINTSIVKINEAIANLKQHFHSWDKDAKYLIDLLKARSAILSGRQRLLSTKIQEAEKIEKWQKGETKPSEFAAYVANIAYDEDKDDVRANFQNKINGTPGAQDDNWDGLNDSSKMDIANDMQHDDATAITLRGKLKAIKSDMEDIEGEYAMMDIDKICDNSNKFIRMMTEPPPKDPNDPGVWGMVKASYDMLDIQFYSVEQLMQGWKMYWDARNSAKEQVNRRVGAKFAQQVGMFMKWVSPFPEFNKEIDQMLKSSIDGEDNKEKSGYIDYLKSGPETFDGLFGDGGLFMSQQYNYNRTRAILEYAAENGWLYDMDIHNQKVMGVKLIAGKNISPNDNPKTYVEVTLANAQASGESHAKDHGKQRIKTEESIPPIAEVLQEELDNFNYWAIDGIWEVALGKAKWGHTPEYLHLIVLNHLRKHPTARKYFPIKLYDQLKNYGLYAFPGSMIERGDMHKWQTTYMDNNAEAEAHVGEAGHLARATVKIEKRIEEIATASHKKVPKGKALTILVAQVLAGQVIKESGWNRCLSIYDNESEFTEYRHFASGFKGGKIREQDDDYFDPTMGSSALLFGVNGLKAILKKLSQRNFDAEDRAKAFLAMVITRYDELYAYSKIDASVKPAFENFKERMRINFDQWAIEEMNDSSSAPFADFETYSVGINPDGSKKEYKNAERDGIRGAAFGEIARRGMLSVSVLQQLKNEKGKDFALKVAKHAGISLSTPSTGGGTRTPSSPRPSPTLAP